MNQKVKVLITGICICSMLLSNGVTYANTSEETITTIDTTTDTTNTTNTTETTVNSDNDETITTTDNVDTNTETVIEDVPIGTDIEEIVSNTDNEEIITNTDEENFITDETKSPIEVEEVLVNEVEKVIASKEIEEIITFNTKTNLYDSPDANSKIVGVIAPQKSFAIQQSGDFKMILTWLGPKWVNTNNTTFENTTTLNETLFVNKNSVLYKHPSDHSDKISMIAPQLVNVISKYGDFLKINTWLGPMWIKYTPPVITNYNEKITLLENASIYLYESELSQKVGTLAPQTLTASKKTDTGLYLVNTWLGPRWLKPNRFVVGNADSTTERIAISFQTYLYESPDKNSKIVGALAPQTVTAIAKQNDWIKIKSYAGDAWLNTTKPEVIPENKPISKIILLDAGHGGKDGGAIAKDGTREEDINLQFALASKLEIEKKGYKVVMVREKDMSCLFSYKVASDELQCRVDLVKKNNADIYISIHANSSLSTTPNGTEVYYNNTRYSDGAINPFPQQSKSLATVVLKGIQPALQTKNNGVKTSNFYVLRKNKVPAILIETGFLSNTSDLQKLKNNQNQKKFAIALANALKTYFN